jgi:hypothetical protein
LVKKNGDAFHISVVLKFEVINVTCLWSLAFESTVVRNQICTAAESLLIIVAYLNKEGQPLNLCLCGEKDLEAGLPLKLSFFF